MSFQSTDPVAPGRHRPRQPVFCDRLDRLAPRPRVDVRARQAQQRSPNQLDGRIRAGSPVGTKPTGDASSVYWMPALRPPAAFVAHAEETRSYPDAPLAERPRLN